jgi:hypothetical protein
VAYLLNARTVEPEKQPLLENGSETTLISRQRPPTDKGTTSVTRQQIRNKQEKKAAAREWLHKHVPTATDKHETE